MQASINKKETNCIYFCKHHLFEHIGGLFVRSTKTKPFGKLLRRFKRERKGSTAVEFALIITPFLMLTMGTLEIALIHLSRSSMADALEKTSRQIMTGEAACLTAEEYITQLCDRLSFANGSCNDNTKVVMQELATFSSDPGADEQNFDNITSAMENGRENSIMLLRAYHRWNVMFPLLDDALGGGNGELILVSNLAFRNEPFSATDGCVPPST
jgi:Flp pilus assembly protein TadG